MHTPTPCTPPPHAHPHPMHRWGWRLPEGQPGRGSGSKSFLHTLTTAATLHDASYWCPILLHSPPQPVGGADSSRAESKAGQAATQASPTQHIGGVGGGREGAPQPPLVNSKGGLGQPAAAAHRDAPAAEPSATAGTEASRLLACMRSVLSPEAGGKLAAALRDGGEAPGVGWEVEAMLHGVGEYPYGAVGPVRIAYVPAVVANAEQLGKAGPAGGAAAAAAAGAEEGGAGPEAALCIWIHGAAAAEGYAVLLRALNSAGCMGWASPLPWRRLELRGAHADPAVHALLPQQLQSVASALPHGRLVHLAMHDPRLAQNMGVGGLTSTLPPPSAAQLALPTRSMSLMQPQRQLAPPLSEAQVSARRHALRQQALSLSNPWSPALDAALAPDSAAAAGGRAQQGWGAQHAKQAEQASTHCPAALVRVLPPSGPSGR